MDDYVLDKKGRNMISKLLKAKYITLVGTSRKGNAIFDTNLGRIVIPSDFSKKYMTKKKQIKNLKSDWVDYTLRYFDFRGAKSEALVKWRTSGRKIQMVYGKYVVESQCRKDDDFCIQKGLDLAEKRMVLKILENDLELLAIAK